MNSPAGGKTRRESRQKDPADGGVFFCGQGRGHAAWARRSKREKHRG